MSLGDCILSELQYSMQYLLTATGVDVLARQVVQAFVITLGATDKTGPSLSP